MEQDCERHTGAPEDHQFTTMKGCTGRVCNAENVHDLEVTLLERWCLVVCYAFGGCCLLSATVVLPWTVPGESIPHVMSQPCV